MVTLFGASFCAGPIPNFVRDGYLAIIHKYKFKKVMNRY